MEKQVDGSEASRAPGADGCLWPRPVPIRLAYARGAGRGRRRLESPGRAARHFDPASSDRAGGHPEVFARLWMLRCFSLCQSSGEILSNTLVRLGELFQDVFDDDELEISRETSAANIDGWDSLMHVHLVVATERAFNVRFSSTEVATLLNVGELVDLIDAKTDNAAN